MSRLDRPDRPEAEEDDDDGTDYRDREFELQYDQTSLRQRLETSRSKTRRDVILMKTILLNGKPSRRVTWVFLNRSFRCDLGFYPQFAIADENNVNRKDSELLFHSKEKQFVSIHPSSIYYYRPELTYLGKGIGCTFVCVIDLLY